MLMHHTQTGLNSFARSAKADNPVVYGYLALIGGVQAEKDVHEGGFPRAILTEQCVNLARLYEQIDTVIGHHTGESLHDALHANGVLDSTRGRVRRLC